MPISFSRLRIAGFKSFAEPAVVEILPGLTGVVGPNGCGKSNVVEALRWAMGESSARSLRGGEMDDVIFAGTASRPSRNIAEVTLLLDGTHGAAPPPFHEAHELEVSRRIERGQGSAFRINGREARARDVQTLFNDLATGAHSSGLVSQGHVGALVNARPDERRMLLEEAAGITGLHARRHEAELKLRAAEANLARADDLRGQLEAQGEGLKRQVRQASRYRSISASVRAQEAELLSLQRAGAAAVLDGANQALHQARGNVADATAGATAAGAEATVAAAVLPGLRSAEGNARTALERHRLTGEQIAAAEVRATTELHAAAARLAQIAGDLGHAEQASTDAAGALHRLRREADGLAGEDAAHPPRMVQAERLATEAAARLQASAANCDRATEHAAELSARHRALTEALAQANQRATRLGGQRAMLHAEQATIAARMVAPEALVAADAERRAAGAAADCARAALAQAEAGRAVMGETHRVRRLAAQEAAASGRAAAQRDAAQARDAARAEAMRAREAATTEAARLRQSGQGALAATRDAAAAAETNAARLAAEAQALKEVLAVKDGERWPPMVDQLAVPPGLEAALGAALGEELDSAADTGAARHWRCLPPLDPLPALPQGAERLDRLVQAPGALARCLSQIGLTDAGDSLRAGLLPGQMLVSREGAVWRWDGYTIQPGTPSAAAVRLRQRNRLSLLALELEAACAAAVETAAARDDAEARDRAARTAADTLERSGRADADAREAAARAAADAAERGAQAVAQAAEQAVRTAAEQAEREAGAVEATARTARSDAERRLDLARADAANVSSQNAEATARMAGLDAQAARLDVDADEAAAALTTARADAAALPDPAGARQALDRARACLTMARTEEDAAREAAGQLARAATGRANRAGVIGRETADWALRAREADLRVGDLRARSAEAHAAHATLAAAPGEIAVRHARALDALQAAEAVHAGTAEALVQADQAALAADRTARAAEAALAVAREQVVRCEGNAAQAVQGWAAMAERIAERLGEVASLPDPPARIDAEAEEKTRRKLERLQREREEIGPVNLRAEIEADEIAAQIDAITREHGDLTTAIARLRGSIGHLNREGRERLAAVFAEVDRHFQTLFARMFGGGRAHLAMVGSDDPLTAGLEIYAQPPSKKLATLSLLSGGEQALTALSLIFAVFRCNPAPVCVLDEVDAALDDANVERFCGLLEDMVRETGTRFLVVTHHATTMARMDRLYGVTMQERGVSRLLSVDLQRATALVVERPGMAAE